MAEKYGAYYEQMKRDLAEEKEKLRKDLENLAHIKDVADSTRAEYSSIKFDCEEIVRLIEQQHAISTRNREHLNDELLNYRRRNNGALQQMDDVLNRYDSETEDERKFFLRTCQEIRDIPRKNSDEAIVEKTKEVLLTTEKITKDIEERAKKSEKMTESLNAEAEELNKRNMAISAFISEQKVINVKLEVAKFTARR